jgi:hypothetical protein
VLHRLIAPTLLIAAFLCATPRAQQSAADAQRNGELPGPLPILPADNWWNQDVSQAPLDARSAQFITFVNNGGLRRLHPDFGGYESPGSVNIYGFPFVVVGGNQPKRAVSFYYDTRRRRESRDRAGAPFSPIPDDAISQPHWIEAVRRAAQILAATARAHRRSR